VLCGNRVGIVAKMKLRNDRQPSAQRRQETFDSGHGLRAVGRRVLRRGPDWGPLQFAALALCGECGELANALKKVIRSQTLSTSAAQHIDHARRELADIYAYLLKLASLLEVDLDEEYLETLGLNYLRFPIKNRWSLPRVIGIAGQSAVQIANGLRRETASGEAPNMDFLTLPVPPTTSPQRYLAWLRSAKTKIARQLSVTRGDVLVLVNDPVLCTISYRRVRRKPPYDDSATILQCWISIEELICAKGSSRHLLLTQDASPSASVEKLVRHGANVIENGVDWLTIQKITARTPRKSV
jgi:dCTP diphosphatase